MKKIQCQEEACPVREVLDRVAGKWSILIVVAAAHGPVRFTELERSIDGISRRMLTLTLRNLERDGLLTRTAYPAVPPRVEYELTPIARELHESLTALTAWADKHRTTITAARDAYDQRTKPRNGLPARAQAKQSARLPATPNRQTCVSKAPCADRHVTRSSMLWIYWPSACSQCPGNRSSSACSLAGN
jgi:DNA-binding HxlR family transcriptional regulator